MKLLKRENPNSSIYSEYIYRHVTNVIRSWNEVLFPSLEKHMDEFELTDLDLLDIAKVLSHHDESKWQEPEWTAYLNHFYPTDEFPNDETKFDYAWLHHQHHNRHHWQHWLLVRDEGNLYPMDMPFSEICNMLCDWHSFSAKHENNTAYEWYQKQGDKMILSNYTRDMVEKLVEFMKEPLSPEEGD